VTRTRQHLQGFSAASRPQARARDGRGEWLTGGGLSTLAFQYTAQQIAFQDYVDAVMDAETAPANGSRNRYTAFFPNGICAQLLTRLQAMRGIALINAVVLVADVRRLHTLLKPTPTDGLISASSRASNQVVRTIRHTGITKNR